VRTRLRPAYTDLSDVYTTPYDHTRWADHIGRVTATVEFALGFDPAPDSIADLSCGDGAIPQAIGRWAARCLNRPVPLVLGDLVGDWPIRGRIESTVDVLPEVDLYVCSETVEHLDDPDAVLATIATKARRLLLSTPLGETSTENPEHYWGWDFAGVRELLTGSGWTPTDVTTWTHPTINYYTFQFWAAQRTATPVAEA